MQRQLPLSQIILMPPSEVADLFLETSFCHYAAAAEEEKSKPVKRMGRKVIPLPQPPIMVSYQGQWLETHAGALGQWSKVSGGKDQG
jgi:hypothetical protein